MGIVVGTAVGGNDGLNEVSCVGERVAFLVGDSVGRPVGCSGSGRIAGAKETSVLAGDAEGGLLVNGEAVSAGVLVGWDVGDGVGPAVGMAVGMAVGDSVGMAVGMAVGEGVGMAVGDGVGMAVGMAVGEGVGMADG